MPSSSYLDLYGLLSKLHTESPEAAQKVCEVIRENAGLLVGDDFKPEPVNIKAIAKYECVKDHPFEVDINSQFLPSTHPYYCNVRKLLNDLVKNHSYTSISAEAAGAVKATVYVDLGGAAYLNSLYSSAVLTMTPHNEFSGGFACIAVKRYPISASYVDMSRDHQKWIDWAAEHLSKPMLFHMSRPDELPREYLWSAYTTDEDEARMFKLFWTNR